MIIIAKFEIMTFMYDTFFVQFLDFQKLCLGKLHFSTIINACFCLLTDLIFAQN